MPYRTLYVLPYGIFRAALANLMRLPCRTPHQGRPIRTFFAFDPRRSAILLIGGDKTGDDRFYQRMIPVADQLYDEHLEELKKEGLL